MLHRASMARVAAFFFTTFLAVSLGCRGSEPNAPAEATTTATEATTSTAVSADAWVDITDREAGIVAQFPIAPKREAMSTVVEGRPGTVTVMAANTTDASFVLNVIQWPMDLETRDVGTILENGWKQGLATVPNATVLSKTTVSIDGHRGLRGSLRYTSKEGEAKQLHSLSFISGPRMVMALVEHEGSADRGADVERFFGSVHEIR